MKIKRNIIAFFVIFNILSLFAIASEIEELVPDYTMESDRYIVTLKEGSQCTPPEGMGSLLTEMSKEEMTEFVEETIEGTSEIISEIGMIRATDSEALDELIEMGVVEYYEPDYIMYLYGYDYPQNTAFSSQWGHSYINSHYAWNAGVFGKDVRVAVIDSGVYPHKDLANNLLEGKSYVDDTTEDVYGHGTFVAGIIAAECNNLATVGLAHRAKIVPLKVTNGKSLNMSDAIQAMNDAVDIYKCDVINVSLGTTHDSTALREAVAHVLSKDHSAILVSAAGNDGTTAYSYPASYENVVSVANAQRENGTLVIRQASQHNDRVNIAAPGTDLCSLWKEDTGVSLWTGTSFACPYVAAAAALCKSIRPGLMLNQAQFMFSLDYTANKSYMTETQGSEWWGSGLLDVGALVKFMIQMTYDDDFYVSPADEQVYGNNTSIYITNIKNRTGKLGKVALYNYIDIGDKSKRLNRIRFVPVNLVVDKSMEISLTQLGMYGKVHYSMLSDKLKPLITPLRTVAVEDKTAG